MAGMQGQRQWPCRSLLTCRPDICLPPEPGPAWRRPQTSPSPRGSSRDRPSWGQKGAQGRWEGTPALPST